MSATGLIIWACGSRPNDPLAMSTVPPDPPFAVTRSEKRGDDLYLVWSPTSTRPKEVRTVTFQTQAESKDDRALPDDRAIISELWRRLRGMKDDDQVSWHLAVFGGSSQ